MRLGRCRSTLVRLGRTLLLLIGKGILRQGVFNGSRYWPTRRGGGVFVIAALSPSHFVILQFACRRREKSIFQFRRDPFRMAVCRLSIGSGGTEVVAVSSHLLGVAFSLQYEGESCGHRP